MLRFGVRVCVEGSRPNAVLSSSAGNSKSNLSSVGYQYRIERINVRLRCGGGDVCAWTSCYEGGPKCDAVGCR